MDITKIDKNFDTSFTPPEDIEWFSVKEKPFEIYGVFYSESEGKYRRMPKDIADKVSLGVSELSKQTAGGRIRFITDSPYYAVKVTEPFVPPFSNMSFMGIYGVTVYANGSFSRCFAPTYAQVLEGDKNGQIIYDGLRVHPDICDRRSSTYDGLKEQLEDCNNSGNLYEMELYLPPYSELSEIIIGIKKGSKLLPPKPYKHENPIIFYGSSITQGACGSKPGDDYISMLSRSLGFDYVNLGFSGNAKAEKVMVDYIVEQNPPVFVLDYDHNAPNSEYLKKTHYPLYQAVRDAHPNTPIILMTMPIAYGFENISWFKTRREIILENFNKMIASGDKNVYLVDCIGCLGEWKGDRASIDNCHPDSVGFINMKERLYSVLNKLLNKTE